MEINDECVKSINIHFKQHSTYELKDDGAIHKTKNKKRIATEHWVFSDAYYSTEKQIELLRSIQANHGTNASMEKLMLQEIKKKISGYKQQDIHKKLFNENEFLTIETIIEKMLECELKCYYCSKEMHVLYDIQRESSQWSVDRIDNDLGHNNTNFYVACLDCNIRRRRRSDAKYLLTKQMIIVKK
jgi:hypothetical protein